MSPCDGRGNCIRQCVCTCYDQDCAQPVCFCGHRTHTKIIGGDRESDIYCKKPCDKNCELKECTNYRLCKKKCPQVFLDCYNGMCMDCAIRIAKIRVSK
jgi:hypothetical protein